MSLHVRAVRRFTETRTMPAPSAGSLVDESCKLLAHLVSVALLEKVQQHGTHPFAVEGSRRIIEGSVAEWLRQEAILKLDLDIAPDASQCVQDRYEVTFSYGQHPTRVSRVIPVLHSHGRPACISLQICRECRLSATLTLPESTTQAGWQSTAIAQSLCRRHRDALETWGVGGIMARLVHFGPRERLSEPTLKVKSYRP